MTVMSGLSASPGPPGRDWPPARAPACPITTPSDPAAPGRHPVQHQQMYHYSYSPKLEYFDGEYSPCTHWQARVDELQLQLQLQSPERHDWLRTPVHRRGSLMDLQLLSTAPASASGTAARS